MKIGLALLISCISIFLAFGGYAEAEKQKATDQKVAPAESAKAKGLTKEEAITRLNNIFKYNPDAVRAIAGLEANKGESGIYYQYKGKKLEGLDSAALNSILKTANAYMSSKSVESMNKQMKALKQINDINKMQRMRNQQTEPKLYGPPKMQSVPKTYNPNPRIK